MEPPCPRDAALAFVAAAPREEARALAEGEGRPPPLGRLLHCGVAAGGLGLLGAEVVRRARTLACLESPAHGAVGLGAEEPPAGTSVRVCRLVAAAEADGTGAALCSLVAQAAELLAGGCGLPLLLCSGDGCGQLSAAVAAGLLEAAGRRPPPSAAAAPASQASGHPLPLALPAAAREALLSAGGEGSEAAWLKQDLRQLHRLARQASEGRQRALCGEMAAAGLRLAALSPAADAAAALYLSGWASARLPGGSAAAREALSLGRLLAGGGRAKAEVAEQLTRELAALPALGVGLPHGALVVEPRDSQEAVDPERQALVLDLPPATAAAEAAPSWQLLSCPKRFAWVIYGPPTSLLASGETPCDGELLALQRLDLPCLVQVGDSGEAAAVEEAAEALRAGRGCFLHAAPGCGARGVAVACFLCKYGFGFPEDWSEGQPPAHSASEAADLVRGLCGEAALGGAAGEEAVRFFERALWAEIMMGRVRKRQRKAPEGQPSDQPEERVKAKVVRQPGDGNCLFHSLAHGLGGGEKAASLRKKVCEFLRDHPALDISGTSLEEWVQMTAQCSVEDYARRMQRPGEWGGAPEIAVCARMKGVDVHVYEPRGSDFALVAPFYGGEDGVACGRVVRVVYSGRMHYDALSM